MQPIASRYTNYAMPVTTCFMYMTGIMISQQGLSVVHKIHICRVNGQENHHKYCTGFKEYICVENVIH